MSFERNVLGGELEICSTDPLTGWFRDGYARASSDDPGSHTIAAVLSQDFLEHQLEVGNDLITALPQYGFPGLLPGERWAVCAPRWHQSFLAGRACGVLLASTSEGALEHTTLAALTSHSVDVPPDLSSL
ncbi:unannotated protein [freshwater metagenome]|uniref:Unannotated protein n=1 Tax=freshwater metagenome TaxID=449393 RepID=A0A6J7BBB4_9ZZZZ|nr:DUF2237 family protein [Actinomycetota bacterium]MSY51710.1 DUF2237 family protein [Actinomycetota bacterium]MSY87349.1 DUF2237 family protein [Actinomycetota bacterium]